MEKEYFDSLIDSCKSFCFFQISCSASLHANTLTERQTPGTEEELAKAKAKTKAKEKEKARAKAKVETMAKAKAKTKEKVRAKAKAKEKEKAKAAIPEAQSTYYHRWMSHTLELLGR